MHGEEDSSSGSQLENFVESEKKRKKKKNSNNTYITTVVWEGFKKNPLLSSRNKLQHIQSDTTGTSNKTRFYGQMKLKKELFGSKPTRWVRCKQG